MLASSWALLRFPQRRERAIVERGVKSNSRFVQLLDDGHIQLLLRDQKFQIAATTRRRNGRVEKSLRKIALRKSERLCFIRKLDAMSTFRARDGLEVCIGIGNRTQD